MYFNYKVNINVILGLNFIVLINLYGIYIYFEFSHVET